MNRIKRQPVLKLAQWVLAISIASLGFACEYVNALDGLPKKLKETEEKVLELTDMIEFQQLLIDALVKNDKKLYQKLKNVNSGPAEPVDPKAIPAASKKKLFIMKIKLNNFNLMYNKFPEDVQELKNVLDNIPIENRSGSSTVHIKDNGLGGWVYDPDSGDLNINSWKK